MLRGERVILRQWKESDKTALCALNADPLVMEFFPSVMTEAESLAQFDRFSRAIAERGFGLWAVEVDGAFAGITGLKEPSSEPNLPPGVEIGWRFHQRYWGRGLALESARLALDYAFSELKLSEVVSFAAVPNQRSWRLMQRLGFTSKASENFHHPKIPVGHWLSEHVLYRMSRSSFAAQNPKALSAASRRRRCC
jgi:RimJ/RimL family protein N-acetyltransferase